MRLSQTESARLRRQMLDFCQRVMNGNGTEEELRVLPQVIALLIKPQNP